MTHTRGCTTLFLSDNIIGCSLIYKISTSIDIPNLCKVYVLAKYFGTDIVMKVCTGKGINRKEDCYCTIGTISVICAASTLKRGG